MKEKITREKYAKMDRLERERVTGELGVLLFLDHIGNISEGGKRDLAAMIGE